MTNIVIFGPIHSGKTSLMGFIKASCMSREERENAERQIERELTDKSVKYKDEDKYTYYITTDKDEVTTDSKQNSIGTTKRMHIKNVAHIPNGDVEADLIFIDTPGQNIVRTWKDRYEGIYMGDIGVYVVDVNEVIGIADLNRDSEEYVNAINELFSYLYLWKTTKSMNDVIIVLSKIDTVAPVDVQYAKETIEAMKHFKNVPVIPIGINFVNDTDYNILTFDNVKGYYQGITFVKKLFELLNGKIAFDRKKNISFAYLERPRQKVETEETVFRVKILEGCIKQGEKALLLPIKRKDSEFDKVLFTAKSMKLEDRHLVDCMVASNIGGILPTKVMLGNNRINIDEISIIKTTCIIGEKTPYIMGNLLSFRTRLYNKVVFNENFMKIRINQSINIVWFGKVLTASFCSKYVNGNYCYFNAYLHDYPIVMPIYDKENYCIKNFALEVNNCYFFQAELESINNLNRDLNKIYFSFRKEDINLSKSQIEECLNLNIRERGGNYEVWKDASNSAFKILTKDFGKFVAKYKIQDYIYTVIGSDGEIQNHAIC